MDKRVAVGLGLGLVGGVGYLAWRARGVPGVDGEGPVGLDTPRGPSRDPWRPEAGAAGALAASAGFGRIPPAAIPATTVASGMLPRWLVDRGYFGRGFGPRTTSTGAVRPHSAVDITASRGQPIRAILPGIVEWAGWVNGYGNCTLIRHADGMTSFYAHATRLLVAVGNTVAQGQQVAEVGNTGFERMGTHLHTAVHRGLPQGVRMTTDVEARYGVDPRPVWASLGTAMVREIGE